MTLRKAILAATMMTLPAAAMAQPISGLYVGGGVGGDYLMQNTVKATQTNGGVSSSLGSVKTNDKNLGVAGVASVGYGFGNGLRAELEFGGRNNHVNISGGGGANVTTYGPMVNGLYDIDLGAAVTPYVGAGVGYQFSQINNGAAYSTSGNVQTLNTIKTSTKGALAAQAILGVAYPIAAAPGLALTAEYRFLGALANEKFGGTVTQNGVAAGTSSNKFGNQYHDSLLVGFRYAFGAAPAPVAAAAAPVAAPMVAPAPAPARSYLVFFDWDKADLSARAQQIIAEAASNSTRVASTKIDVAGHADKTGTEAYNQTLSLKRANNVAAELVRLGVPKAAISITAYGDTKPLVPTAEGVREPQNRRVEIVLH